MTATLLTQAQSKQIEAAAAVLRVDQRELFCRSVAMQLGRFPSDTEVTAVIRSTIGIEPYLGDFQHKETDHGLYTTP